MIACGSLINVALTFLVIFPRQDRESADRAHGEEIASVSLAARERERELTVMLQQTGAEHRERGQYFSTTAGLSSSFSLATLLTVSSFHFSELIRHIWLISRQVFKKPPQNPFFLLHLPFCHHGPPFIQGRVIILPADCVKERRRKCLYE